MADANPLNVPVPLKISGLPAAAPPGFATPHKGDPPQPAVTAHTPGPGGAGGATGHQKETPSAGTNLNKK